MLQTLLDVAIQEQNLENSNDSARINQLVEILAIKDEANRDLHRGVQELETALAEARMNLEYLHSKWRDEAVAREEADTTVNLLRSQIDASQVLPPPCQLCLGVSLTNATNQRREPLADPPARGQLLVPWGYPGRAMPDECGGHAEAERHARLCTLNPFHSEPSFTQAVIQAEAEMHARLCILNAFYSDPTLRPGGNPGAKQPFL